MGPFDWHTEMYRSKRYWYEKPVPIMIGIGLLMLILVLGVIMWTSRDLSYSSMSTKPVGTSTLSHGDPAPVRQGLYQTDQSSSPLAGP